MISYLSQLMTLHPGDVIATGTPPPGVGMGMTPPPTYLRDEDQITLTINGLGTQTAKVIAD